MPNISVISYHSSPLDQPGVGDGGGMNVYVRQLCTALARQGTTVNVFTRAVSPNQRPVQEIEPGLTVHNVPAGPLSRVPKERLSEYIQEFSDHVLSRIKVNPSLRPDFVHSNYWLSGLVGHKLKHELGVPMVTTFHTLERVKRIDRDEPDDNGIEEFRIKSEDVIAECSDVVLASCAQEAADIERHLMVSPERLKVLGLGVEHAFFAPGNQQMARRAVSLPEHGSLILYVGRIQPLKGLFLAFEAFNILRATSPHSYLVVVGGPSGSRGEHELERCAKYARDNGFVEQVIWRKAEPHLRLASYYRACDAIVVPSRTESFGLVALEAMASGRSVVASSVGGLKSLITHGVDGFLVNQRTSESFANELGKAISESKFNHSIRNSALRRARDFSWNESAKQLLEIANYLTSRQLTECR